MKALKILAAVTAIGLVAGTVTLAQDNQEDGFSTTRLLMPELNADRGMELFASKGCATCHSVNGVGGEDASPLDVDNMDAYMNPFDLAAKMWLMAPYMIAAQEDELGEQILFTGDELSNIIAFLHDSRQQSKFTEEYLVSVAGEALAHGGDDEEDEDHDEDEGDDEADGEDEDHDDDEAPHG